jgi:hypothetical protein
MGKLPQDRIRFQQNRRKAHAFRYRSNSLPGFRVEPDDGIREPPSEFQ